MLVRLSQAAVTAGVLSILNVLVAGAADARPIEPPADSPVVRAGGPCRPSEAGDVGRTGTDPVPGSGVICIKAPGHATLRWRPLDSSTSPLVGAIDRLYQAYFDRPVDGEGFAHWIDLRVDGVPLVTISDFFYTSAEFSPRALDPDNFHDESLEPYVSQAYELVLHRRADREGYTYWFEVLHEAYFGTPSFVQYQNVRHPGLMMALLSQSAESRAKTHTI